MSIADHVAIFLMGSLDQPRPGKAKPNKPEYWGQFAFPPTAETDLLAACTAVAPNGSLNGLQLAPKVHRNLAADKQFPGIPADWYIVRMGTGPDFPPDLFLLDGQKISALPLHAQQIRADFYSGQRVRVNAHTFAYPAQNGGRPGVSFSLSGLLAVGGGERRPGSNDGVPSESAFSAYRQDAPTQQSDAFGGQSPQQAAQQAIQNGQDAFGGNQSAQNAVANDPFAQKPATGGGAFG